MPYIVYFFLLLFSESYFPKIREKMKFPTGCTLKMTPIKVSEIPYLSANCGKKGAIDEFAAFITN
jgi:hypothetical protein